MKALKKYFVAVVVFAFVAMVPTAAQKANKIAPELWTLTYLKAKTGQRERLNKFLEKNWLALDRIAVEQKLIRQYRLVRNPNPANRDWDAVVAVEYNDDRRFEGVKIEFERIRGRHQKILIEGLDFKDLGEIVRTETSTSFNEKDFLAKAADYKLQIENWRTRREAGLKSENGWLTLAGLFWLETGANPVGSGEKNAIVLPHADGSIAARIGTINFDGTAARLSLENVSQARADGKPVVGEIELKSDDGGSPTVVEIAGVKFHLIKRGSRYGVRVKDPNNQSRREFSGLKWFPVNEDLKIKARFEAYPEPTDILVPNVLGDENKSKSPGLLTFRIGGKEFGLAPVADGNKLFIIFRDLTSRRESYPAGRFLYADWPESGEVVLDFNKAENPPCAFTPFATCPLPPSQNRLEVEIPAGEKRYHSELGYKGPERKPGDF